MMSARTEEKLLVVVQLLQSGQTLCTCVCFVVGGHTLESEDGCWNYSR